MVSIPGLRLFNRTSRVEKSSSPPPPMSNAEQGRSIILQFCKLGVSKNPILDDFSSEQIARHLGLNALELHESL